MADISVWADEIMMQVSGASVAVVKQVIRATVREFCHVSGAWMRQLPAVDVVAGQARYTLPDPADGRVLTVQAVTYTGAVNGVSQGTQFLVPIQSPSVVTVDSVAADSPIYYYGDFEAAGVITLVPPPARSVPDALVAYVSLGPKTNSGDEVADVLANSFFETILDGALGRLMEIPDRPFTNLALAQYRLRRFRSGMSTARDTARRQWTTATSGFVFAPWGTPSRSSRRVGR